MKELKGNIIVIRGRHDKIEAPDKFVLKYKGHTFLLVHNPYDAKNWKGWIIHGHMHNHDLEKFPFVNKKNKTINVSVELINYTPVLLDDIIKVIK